MKFLSQYRFSDWMRIVFIVSIIPGFFFFPNPSRIDLDNVLLPAFTDTAHPLGTDRLGRDIYSLYSYGILGTIFMAIPARILTIIVSLCISFLSYRLGRILSNLLELLSSVFISLPSLLVALTVVGLYGEGLSILFLAIVLSDWALVYETLEAKVREVKNSGHSIAAFCMGASKIYIYKKHIFPTLLSVVNVLFITGVPSVIMTVAIFSFLGINSSSDFFGPGLGEQISFSRDYFEHSPESIIIPCIGIFLLVNLSGYNITKQ
jgi:peptide/nickel transport system permease protein